MSSVHTVVILSTVFCIICSLLTFVVDACGYHIVETSVGYLFQSAFLRLKLILQSAVALLQVLHLYQSSGGVYGVHDLFLIHVREAFSCKYEVWVIDFLPTCTVGLLY